MLKHLISRGAIPRTNEREQSPQTQPNLTNLSGLKQKSNFRLLFLTLILAGFSMNMFGQSGKTGTLTWTLANGTLTVKGNGAMPDYKPIYIDGGLSHYDSPWDVIHYEIKTVTIENGVTKIGKNAFRECYNSTSVTIPNSVTSIGEYAFFDCRSLTSINIPSSVTSIGEYIFFNCGLTSVTVNWETPPAGNAILNTIFYEVDLSAATLHVPVGTKAAYQNVSPWKDFGTIIDDVKPSATEIVAQSSAQYYKGVLTVNTPKAERLTVYSVSGVTVFAAVKPEGRETYNLSTLPVGVYIVKGESGWIKKILKE